MQRRTLLSALAAAGATPAAPWAAPAPRTGRAPPRPSPVANIAPCDDSPSATA